MPRKKTEEKSKQNTANLHRETPPASPLPWSHLQPSEIHIHARNRGPGGLCCNADARVRPGNVVGGRRCRLCRGRRGLGVRSPVDRRGSQSGGLGIAGLFFPGLAGSLCVSSLPRLEVNLGRADDAVNDGHDPPNVLVVSVVHRHLGNAHLHLLEARTDVRQHARRNLPCLVVLDKLARCQE